MSRFLSQKLRLQIYSFCLIFLLLVCMSLFTMIGAMSGTSMDGLDLVHCEIRTVSDSRYEYKILNANTYSYPKAIHKTLSQSKSLSAEALVLLDKTLGKFFSDCINSFLKEKKIEKNNLDAIASHGHTVFHRPQLGFTLQIGCGITMARETGIPVINDFRQKDVIAGGQGAPLVPIGDQMLFEGRADAFLNIGGFTNITIPGESTSAFDIGPGNLPLNLAAQELGYEYDESGNLARSGELNQNVLDELNSLPYYHEQPPKSLGTEWLEESFLPILEKSTNPRDRLNTCVIHIADQIFRVCKQNNIKSLFVTGGGAFNKFLIGELRNRSINVILPDPIEINYKEALVFAFLGVRFLEKKHNCLASVTGASENVCGGTMHLP